MKVAIDIDDLIKAGISAVRNVVVETTNIVENYPERALRTITHESGKPALTVDITAEFTFRKKFHAFNNGQFEEVEVFGEESLPDHFHSFPDHGVIALIDSIDGTDLLERGLSNWCSVAVFFAPNNSPGERIIAAFVGVPPRTVYYATKASEGVFVQHVKNGPIKKVSGPSKVKTVSEASICFYGQKAGNFLSVANTPFCTKLDQLNEDAKTRKTKLGLRIYNMAGIPMLVKLADHQIRSARNIDAVFELKGQKAHDCVAGLYIAKKAGASVKNLDGSDLTVLQMEEAVLNASEGKQSYVAASTQPLSEALLTFLFAK